MIKVDRPVSYTVAEWSERRRIELLIEEVMPDYLADKRKK